MLSRLKKVNFLIGKAGRIKFLVLLAFMIINSLLEMVGIGSIPVFIIIISNPDMIMHHRWAAPILDSLHIITSKNLMIWGFIFLAGYFTVKSVFFSLLIYVKNRIIYNEQIRWENRLFNAYMKAPYTFYLNRNSAELLYNVNSETNQIISGVIIPLLEIMMNGLVLVMIIILLLKVEPVISLLTFSVLGTVSFLFMRITKKKTSSYGKEEQQHRNRMNKIVLEAISGIKDVKVLGREKSFLDQYKLSTLRTASALKYRQTLHQLPEPFMETIAVIGMLFICLTLLLMGRKVSSIIPVLALFGAATMRLLPVLRKFISANTDIRYNVYAIDPVYNDLKLLEKDANKPQKKENTTRLDPYPFSSQIVFENVSYRYPQGNAEAISDIILKIPKGAIIGFVGPSGAGKTTIVDILLGLLEPQQGRVLADDQDIFEDVKRWQTNVGYVPQFIHLSDDTIRRNIAFGLPDDEINDFQINQVLRASQLEPLIQELPEGLDTIVGERGVRLSGGQRQRIGIARALYNNPQVLIMDEATSALDNIMEKFVIESIESLRGDRTIIMIAHRLTTVRNCDVIYLINEGCILEQGNYDYLLKNSSTFRKMNLLKI
jgi:ATP-binding cassette subfamily C protein